MGFWGRVFSRDDIGSKRGSAFPIGLDLQFDASMREVLAQSEAASGEVVFSPQLFKKSDIPNDLADCRLDAKCLMKFGQLATRAKLRFTQALGALDRQQEGGEE